MKFEEAFKDELSKVAGGGVDPVFLKNFMRTLDKHNVVLNPWTVSPGGMFYPKHPEAEAAPERATPEKRTPKIGFKSTSKKKK